MSRKSGIGSSLALGRPLAARLAGYSMSTLLLADLERSGVGAVVNETSQEALPLLRYAHCFTPVVQV